MVPFTVTGANPSAEQLRTTGSDGTAQFCYTGLKKGTDTISAYADDNRNDTQDTGEPGNTATKTWVKRSA